MEPLTQENSKAFADLEFGKMSKVDHDWNMLHAECFVKALEELATIKECNLERLKTLAWVHDIGKVKSIENHPSFSLEILKEKFELNDIDIDCLFNHGSIGNLQTVDGKVFRFADGISLFYPETIIFRLYGEAKEDVDLKEFKEKVRSQYEKYLTAYKDDPEACQILKEKFESI